MQLAQLDLSTGNLCHPRARGSEPCLAYRIGGITFGLFSDSGLHLCLTEALSAFEVESNHPCDVRIQIGRADRLETPDGKPTFDSGCLWTAYEIAGGFQFCLTTPYLGSAPYKSAWFDREFTAGRVELSRQYFREDQPLYPLEYPLDELLMIYRLSGGEGMEVHAVGIRDEFGRGHLFLGHSGAGKSTTARLWSSISGIRILSDDRIVLRAHDGGIRMYGTPWHGDAGIASPESAPLYRIYVLEHGPANELVRLPAGRAAGELFTRCFVPFHSGSAIRFALNFFDQAAQRIPCFQFRFLPNQSAVEAVRHVAA